MSRAISVTVYKFAELSAQAKVRAKQDAEVAIGYNHAHEALASITKLAEHFGGKLARYEVDWGNSDDEAILFVVRSAHDGSTFHARALMAVAESQPKDKDDQYGTWEQGETFYLQDGKLCNERDFDDEKGGDYLVAVDCNAHGSVALVYDPTGNHAFLNLILQAPALLAALQACVPCLGDNCGDVAAQAQSVIAKVRA